MSYDPNGATVYRTDPASGRIVAEPRTIMTGPASAPLPPSALAPIGRLRITDYTRPENGPLITTLPLHDSSLEKTQKQFAALQDSALARGLLNPDGTWTDDPSRHREVQLAQLQMETAQDAVHYEQRVAPALKAADDELRERAWVSQTAEGIAKMDEAMKDKPALSRTVRIEGPSGGATDRVHVTVGGDDWSHLFE